MTKREGILLTSRALTLYLLCWGLSDLTYLPQELLSARHHYGTHDYWFTYYGIELSFRIVRIVALFAAAMWLYSCGKQVEAFFFPQEPADPVEQS
jgi:hypothetical protein